MIKCPHCAEMVQNQAIVCPHCRYSVKTNYIALIAAIFLAVLLISAFGD